MKKITRVQSLGNQEEHFEDLSDFSFFSQGKSVWNSIGHLATILFHSLLLFERQSLASEKQIANMYFKPDLILTRPQEHLKYIFTLQD